MSWLIKFSKWISVATIFFSSLWIINLSYFAHSFTEGAVEKINNGDVKVSLATGALASNWQVLIIVSFLYFFIGLYLVWKVKNHLSLCMLVALSSIFTTITLNILVVSAGFELS